jgi:hypothetical protein
MASRQNSSQSSQISSSSNSTNPKDKTTGHAKTKNNGKYVHKFTSESYIRIIEKSPTTTASTNSDKKLLLLDKSSSSSSGHIPMSSNTIINSMNNMPSKRKGTSFQITSVSVTSGNTQQQQRNSNDNNGDDSADDLDESHTDDNISRITDYETPSFSEDTFSREDIFIAQPNAFGTAPVIPTSSQYGLAIVGPPDMGGNGTNLSDVHVSVSDAGINMIQMGQLPKQDADHKNERFKVVKIESTEPFKRGRWMCMDYLDHTTLQAQDDGIDGTAKDDGEESGGGAKAKDETGVESNSNKMLDNGDMDHENEAYDAEVLKAEMMNNHNDHHHHHNHHQPSHIHHPTMNSIPIHNEQFVQNQQHAQSMPQGQIEQIISHETNSSNFKPSSDTLPSQHQQQQQPAIDNSSMMTQQHAQTMTPDMIQRSLHPEQHLIQQQQQQQQFHQGMTLPTNILMQNLGLDQQQQQNHPNYQQQQSQNQASNNIQQQHNEIMGDNNNEKKDLVTSQFQTQQIGTGDNNKLQSSNESDQQQQMGNASTNENLISGSDNNNLNSESMQNTSSPSSSAGLGTATDAGAVSGASEVNNGNNPMTTVGGDDGQSLNEDSER